eukprot:403377383
MEILLKMWNKQGVQYKFTDLRQVEPVLLELNWNKGKSYLYCTCGHSKTQPFCDGAHRALQDYKDPETNQTYKPLKVDIQKVQSGFVWCGCKRNRLEAGPNCDGNHTRIDDW